MTHHPRSLAGAAALALALTVTPGFLTAGQPVPVVEKWDGSVEDLALQKLAPPTGYLTDPKQFAALWNGWKVGEKAPKIDFDKQLVLVATTRGGRLGMKPQLTDQGDLRASAIATRDLRPGFRYLILVVSRTGVKTVNGKQLPPAAAK
jgi:hypothetical protein